VCPTHEVTRETPIAPKKNIVGTRVREARYRLSPVVTQEDLAGRLAAQNVLIDRSAVARIELGERYVLDFELILLARALKTTTSWLLGESDEPRIPKRS
jgi:HTH-type transcriptional regulator, cell division transcriptional repressor